MMKLIHAALLLGLLTVTVNAQRLIAVRSADKTESFLFGPNIQIPMDTVDNVPNTVGAIRINVAGHVKGDVVKLEQNHVKFTKGAYVQLSIFITEFVELHRTKVSYNVNNRTFALVDGRAYELPKMFFSDKITPTGIFVNLYHDAEVLDCIIDLPTLARIAYSNRVEFRIGTTEFLVPFAERNYWRKLYNTLTS